jgi:hypothetical protein
MIMDIAFGIWLGGLFVGATVIAWVWADTQWTKYKNRRYLRSRGLL